MRAYAATDPAKAVSPNPYPASSEEMISSRRGSRSWMKRVTGIWRTTISTPLTAMAVPKSELDSPSVPIATGSPTYPCWKISATRNDSPTTPMKRPSRRTVVSRTSSLGRLPPTVFTTASSGRDSGTFTKTRTAQTSVIRASPRKPAR